MSLLQGWDNTCPWVLGTEIHSPVSLSTVASGRRTILQGLRAFPSLPQVICHITDLAVAILFVSPKPKTWPLTRSLWGKQGISAEVCVCGAAPQQHHVPAASASTGVLLRDTGSPGVWLPRGRLATQRELQLQIGISGCADVSLLH